MVYKWVIGSIAIPGGGTNSHFWFCLGLGWGGVGWGCYRSLHRQMVDATPHVLAGRDWQVVGSADSQKLFIDQSMECFAFLFVWHFEMRGRLHHLGTFPSNIIWAKFADVRTSIS